MSSTPTRSRVLGSHVADPCAAWAYVDEDNIPTPASSDTLLPLWQDAEWRELHERFTSRVRWSPLEAEWRAAVGGKKVERGFQGESLSVWSVILYSEKRVSIPLLRTEQSNKGIHPLLLPESFRLLLNTVWWLMKGDTCVLLNSQFQVPTEKKSWKDHNTEV